VTVNGVRLHYEESGSGPPVVLIHAFPVGRRMWDPQIAALAARHRVIVYDVRGFGLSEALHEPVRYSPGIAVEDARALLEALGAAPAAVCGLSMGGNIAVNLALAHPQVVSALIACDTGAGSEDPVAFAARCEEYAAAADKGIESFIEAAFGWSVFADYGAQGQAQAALLRELVRAQPPHGIALIARHALAPRKPIYALEAGLRALAVPTLVVYGERDEACVQSSRVHGAGDSRGARLEGAGRHALRQPRRARRLQPTAA
jgi:pimeloyl-ACP methyl ester carboxylesterase